MRSSVPTIPSRYLSRVALTALIAGLAAGCSSDTTRFGSNPFSNPFASQSSQTASIPTTQAYPTQRVQSQPLAPVGTVAYPRPVAAQPLPPVGSVGTMPAAPSPQASYHPVAPRPLSTGSVSPRVAGFNKSGWSAEGGTVVAARSGDTVQSLSNRYGVPAEAIMAVNGLQGAYLAPGQQVTIPVYSLRNAAAQAEPRAAQPLAVTRPPMIVAARPAPQPAPVMVRSEPVAPSQKVAPGGLHVVKPGETLTSIAQDYGTTRPRLAQANGIDEWTNVRIGQKLKVPGGAATAEAQEPKPLAKQPARTGEAAPAAAHPVKTVEIKPEAQKPAEKVAAAPVAKVTPAKLAPAKPITTAKVEKPKAVQAAPAEDAEEETASLPAKPAPKAQPDDQVAESGPASDAPQFRWPVKGRVIQAFGQNSDGINISVPEGTEVKAAEGGVVAYAGNELKGYGNLILIRHANGFVTAYAHAKDIEVKRGDTVKRGQTIATAGQTGNVTSPQLLFELRKGATPVDPRQYLAGT
jgi:murein DD-endopeptidase MepM/ murein hydrolase activator NlpD